MFLSIFRAFEADLIVSFNSAGLTTVIFYKSITKPQLLQPNTTNLPSTSSSALICGPDGLPLSEEERAFLEENFGKLDSGPVDENDTGDEYEDFLANGKEIHHRFFVCLSGTFVNLL